MSVERTETSYSYSIWRDVNTHTGIERCVMNRSSFRTFPSFLNPRAYSAHNTWTTICFRSFSSKTQSSFILSTINEQWKYETKSFHTEFLHISETQYPFWMYPYKLWLQRPFTIQKSVSQKSQNRLKVTKSFIFYKKELSQNIDIHTGTQRKRIDVAPFLQGDT